jgi:hypothetical protein
MSTTNSYDEIDTRAYVLAKVFSRSGKVRASRKERLACAFVELREQIRDEVLKVAKNWHVSAQDLRRDFSYAYPDPIAGQFDVLWLEHACEWVIVDLRCSIQKNAQDYSVPDDVLEKMLVDWLVADAKGSQRTPAKFYIPELEGGALKDAHRPLFGSRGPGQP